MQIGTYHPNLDIIELYDRTMGLSLTKVEAALRLEQLAGFVASDRLSFPGLDQPFLNPVRWFQQNRRWPTSLYTCYTHGDLHSQNILLDDNGQAWLIDFYRTGAGHILRDLIELETDIKFNLLDTTHTADSF